MTRFQPAWIVVGATLLTACESAAKPKTAAPMPNDPPSAVESVLTTWYDAIGRHDSAGIAAPLAPTFFIFEDTTVIDRATLIDEIVKSAATGTQTGAALSGFRTVMTDSVAWTSFRNREVWTPIKGKPDTLDFLESVVFQKRGGRWLMERYHATRIDR